MDSEYGGLSSSERQRQTATEIARKKVLAAYSSAHQNVKNLSRNPRRQSLKPPYKPTPRPQAAPTENSAETFTASPYQSVTVQPDWQSSGYQPAAYQRQAIYSQPTSSTATATPAPTTAPTTATYTTSSTQAPISDQSSSSAYTTNAPAAASTNTTLKDVPVNATAVSADWQKYHSAWQDYYQNYYSDYYAKAAQTYLATEKLKNERVAEGVVQRRHRLRRLAPIFVLLAVVLGALFLQYNRLIFAPIMAYVSPDTGSVNTSLEALDPTITETVSPEPRLIIPKLNIDVPVAFNISLADVDNAMNQGVAHYAIPGANALPGQIGNLVITGHSAGDIYSYNPYKFIFSGLERLVPGDLIYVNYESTRYTYQMTGSEVVEPTNVAALIYETDRPMLTLITCTPLGTSRYRLLISAEQISPAYSSDNVAAPDESEHPANLEMPANEPSFFENLWSSIFGS